MQTAFGVAPGPTRRRGAAALYGCAVLRTGRGAQGVHADEDHGQGGLGDRHGAFAKTLAYEGWERSLFPVEWFDSKPERTVANIVDAADAVLCWVRLHIGELPILWNGAGQEYNPDLVVIEGSGDHWVVEVKMDKEMNSADVLGKREAAKRWANYVTADEAVVATWRYLLVSELDVETARGSWEALKRLGS